MWNNRNLNYDQTSKSPSPKAISSSQRNSGLQQGSDQIPLSCSTMQRHGLLRSTAMNNSNMETSLTHSKKRSCGEVMGRATAECTAVVCCCPFAAMDMLVLTLYKAPKGMCNKAIEKRRKKKKNLRLLMQRAEDFGSRDEEEEKVIMSDMVAAEEVAAMDFEMYDKFYGFWRSDSQRMSSTV